MKKIGILLLAVLLCGCQMQNKDTEPKGHEPIEETTETVMQGVIVEKDEQKLVILREDQKLIHLVKEDLDMEPLTIGDRISLSVNRKVSEYDRTFYGKEVTTLDKLADQADAVLSYERYFMDEPPFQTVVTREGVADEYVDIELYSIRDRKQTPIPVTQTLNGTDELILEFDLNAGEFLEGDYYLLATFYDSEQKKENHGTAVTEISMYEEYLYNGIFSISEIGDGYIQVSSISGADDPLGSPNYFNVDLSGMINEETQLPYAVNDYVYIEYDNREMNIDEEGNDSRKLIRIAGQCRNGETNEGAAMKPVIYLYPTEQIHFEVTLDYEGELTVTYPQINANKWQGIADPDGTLTIDGQSYSYLFWEGVDHNVYDLSEGFVVKGEDSAAFLQKTLSQMGLLPKEYNEMIVYWLPLLMENEYNLITFQQEAYSDHARLMIDPQPDSMLRVFMVYQALDEWIDVKEPELEAFEREGFTVIEWGGCELKK